MSNKSSDETVNWKQNFYEKLPRQKSMLTKDSKLKIVGRVNDERLLKTLESKWMKWGFECRRSASAYKTQQST